MTTSQSQKPQKELAWHTRVATTLIAWAVAFGIVYIMLSLFGRQLESLPVALNALIFTGILVPVMGNLVMPIVSKFAAKHITR
jgi:antibiotic biosynthesis monooxygenase (ABM) superfamily enzyme